MTDVPSGSASATDTDGFRSVSDHAGENYIAVLARLHRRLAPRSYLEIGTQTGASLALATCATVAVDPKFTITTDVLMGKPWCMFFRMTSDAFFAQRNPSALLKGPIDVAFLDGMHWCEFLLRDFINTERHTTPSSMIVLHDCAPTEIYMIRRDTGDQTGREHARHQDWWAGDVWKTLYVLRRYRPELSICVLDAPPTGLVLITGLDPSNEVLSRRRPEIVEEMRKLQMEEIGLGNWVRSLNIRPTQSVMEREHFLQLGAGPFQEEA